MKSITITEPMGPNTKPERPTLLTPSREKGRRLFFVETISGDLEVRDEENIILTIGKADREAVAEVIR